MLAERSQPLPVALARGDVRAWIAPLGWAAVVVAGHLVGQGLYNRDPLVRIGAPPLVGTYDLHLGLALLPAVALAAAALAWAPLAARRLRWGGLLLSAWAAGIAWAVALAASDGLGAITAPLRTRYEYLAAVPFVGEPGRFLAGFVAALPTYPTHVKGHPPGFVTLLWVLDRIGLGGAQAAAALVIATGAIAAPAALVALSATAGEAAARRAAPYVAFAPAAVWIATSADAFFAGVAAIGIACFAVAVAPDRPAGAGPDRTAATDRDRAPDGPARAGPDRTAATDRDRAARAGPRAGHAWTASSLALALLAGVVLGAALMLSYGVAPLGLLVVALAVARRAWLALAVAAVGVLAVLGAFAALGFLWLDGLHATRILYANGVSSRRPHDAFLLIDLAAFALAIGPAAVVGLARLRERAVLLLAAPAVAAIAVAALSGLSKGEVERIWLPFVPWILVATAALGAGASRRTERPRDADAPTAASASRARSLGAGRGWLAAQLLLALALQAGVRSPW